MDSERWKQIDRLLQEALERPPGERPEFVRQACAGDEALEREVRSLLASHREAGSFLEDPAIEAAARVFSQSNTGSGSAAPSSARPFPITALSKSWAPAAWA
jgi:hypothetical protein